MRSGRFVTGSAHRPRSGCDYPAAASSIVSQSDSEEFPFLSHPPSPPSLPCHLPEQTPGPRSTGCPLCGSSDTCRSWSTPWDGCTCLLCPPGLPEAAGVHPADPWTLPPLRGFSKDWGHTCSHRAPTKCQRIPRQARLPPSLPGLPDNTTSRLQRAAQPTVPGAMGVPGRTV